MWIDWIDECHPGILAVDEQLVKASEERRELLRQGEQTLQLIVAPGCWFRVRDSLTTGPMDMPRTSPHSAQLLLYVCGGIYLVLNSNTLTTYYNLLYMWGPYLV